MRHVPLFFSQLNTQEPTKTGADDRGDEAERRAMRDESGAVAHVGEVEDHDGHLAIGTRSRS